MATVKNVTAHYRTLLDALMEKRPELAATGHGRCSFTFAPEPEQAFNRGGTDYFVNGRKIDIGAFDSPKHAGLALGDIVRVGAEDFDIDTGDAVRVVNNGDALTWWDRQGELQGVPVNVATPLGGSLWRIEPNLSKGQAFGDLKDLFPGTAVNRNRDMAWERMLAKPSSERRIAVDLTLAQVNEGFELMLKDETGAKAAVKLAHPHEPAPMQAKPKPSSRKAWPGSATRSSRPAACAWPCAANTSSCPRASSTRCAATALPRWRRHAKRPSSACRAPSPSSRPCLTPRTR